MRIGIGASVLYPLLHSGVASIKTVSSCLSFTMMLAVLAAAMWLHTLAWIGLACFVAVAAPTEQTTTSFLGDKRKLTVLLTTTILAVAPSLFENAAAILPLAKKPREAHPHRNRRRRPVADTMNELGACCVRRACRMTQETFRELHVILEPYLSPPRRTRSRKTSRRNSRYRNNNKKKKKGAKNGLISTESRLSCAIRYFAGGRPEDISVVHGVSHSEAFNSVWKVVDAVNVCPVFSISYPSSHEKQRSIAAGFKKKSEPQFSICAGAIDCLLIWIEKPTKAQCKVSQVGAKKWMCGRKKKFGITLQGTCDVDGRFLDIAMEHPASTSDFLAFSTSPPHSKLEQPSFLAPGLSLFGDNAYVNCRCMATPHRQAVVGTVEDNCNFFHS